MVEGKPVGAIITSLVGLTFQAIGAVYLVYMVYYGWARSFWAVDPVSTIFLAAVMIIGVLGVLLMNSKDPSRVRKGSVLVLATSIIAFPTMFGLGFGSLMMFTGSIMGLVWQP